MAAFHSQVMQGTSHFHHRIRKSIFGVTKNIPYNSTAFDTCNRIFNANPGSRNDAVQATIDFTQLLAFGLFFG